MAYERFPGAPLHPTGNPLVDAVGPAAYAERQDVADVTFDGKTRIVPLRIEDHFEVAAEDADPRGMPVVGADGGIAGKISDIWVDRSEAIIRYYQVELEGGDQVLLPMTMARLNRSKGYVSVKSILAAHFKDVPRTRSLDQVTHLEEDEDLRLLRGRPALRHRRSPGAGDMSRQVYLEPHHTKAMSEHEFEPQPGLPGACRRARLSSGRGCRTGSASRSMPSMCARWRSTAWC